MTEPESSPSSIDSATPWRTDVLAAIVTTCCALPAVVAMWDFTVDDSLIAPRYAHQIVQGAGYRFSAADGVTDGVTPLGWAYLLVPFARGGVLSAWLAAKWLGAASWLAGAALLGVAIGRVSDSNRKWLALVLLALCTPTAAWSVAGMETGVVLGLAAAAMAFRVLRPSWSVPCAAFLAAWRPEALPWALVVAATPGRGEHLDGWRRARRLGMTLVPSAAVGFIRWLFFGQLQPLSLLAKQPDFTLGYRYAVACFLLTGPIALLAFRGLPTWVRALQLSVLVHLGAVAIAGGDWMPLSRLMVISLPGCMLAAAYIFATGRPLWAGLRLFVSAAGLIFVAWRVGPRAAKVGPTRLALVDAAREKLQGRCAVGTVDAGWVGAATESRIVDFAGVTDPAVAAMSGGHTSKHVPRGLLDARAVDTVILLLAKGAPVATPWFESRFRRYTEAYLAPRLGAMGFEAHSLRSGTLHYLLATRTIACPLQANEEMR